MNTKDIYKWTEWTWSGPNRPNEFEVERNGLKWTEMDWMDLKEWTEMLDVAH